MHIPELTCKLSGNIVFSKRMVNIFPEIILFQRSTILYKIKEKLINTCHVLWTSIFVNLIISILLVSMKRKFMEIDPINTICYLTDIAFQWTLNFMDQLHNENFKNWLSTVHFTVLTYSSSPCPGGCMKLCNKRRHLWWSIGQYKW